MESSSFDEQMLSEDVSVFLQNPDQCGDWIEKRTAFMHLKTVKQKPRRKVLADSSNNSLASTLGNNSGSNSNSPRRCQTDTKALKQKSYISRQVQKPNRQSVVYDRTSRTPSRLRAKIPSSSAIHRNRRVKTKDELISQQVNTNFLATTTPKKFKAKLAVDTGNTSSPVLPFGQLLVKTPK